MSEMRIGSWGTYQSPEWEERLEMTSDYVIEKTGMDRQKLEELLNILYEENIIK